MSTDKLSAEEYLTFMQSLNEITPKNSVFHMTLRDYFAAKMMQGEAATEMNVCEYDTYALRAYKMADAMLKEREKNSG